MNNCRIRRLPNRKQHKARPDLLNHNYDYYDYIDTSHEFQEDEDRRYKRRPNTPTNHLSDRQKQQNQNIKLSFTDRLRLTSQPNEASYLQQNYRGVRGRPGTGRYKPGRGRDPFPQRRYPGPGPGTPPPPQQQVYVLCSSLIILLFQNVLALMANQLRDSLSAAFYGNRKQATFPRIQVRGEDTLPYTGQK